MQPMPAFVALDAGTGGGKCVIFDARGPAARGAPRAVGVRRSRLNPDIPFVKEFSFSAPAFWDILCRCTRLALAQVRRRAGGRRRRRHHQPARRLRLPRRPRHRDLRRAQHRRRGFNEGLEVLNTLGQRTPVRDHRPLGAVHLPAGALPVVPQARHGHRSRASLMINDWMTYRLSGELSAEPSNATESMLFDLEQRALVGRDPRRPSTFRAASCRRCTAAGSGSAALTAAAAAATGLLAGTPVFVGGADTQCSLLGAGAIEPGDTGATLGTTTPVQTVVDRAVFDPTCNLWAGCHVRPGPLGHGKQRRRHRRRLSLVARSASAAARRASSSTRSPSSWRPRATGHRRCCSSARRVFNIMNMRFNRPGGILFPFPALHVRPDRGTLLRAFLESIGYALRGQPRADRRGDRPAGGGADAQRRHVAQRGVDAGDCRYRRRAGAGGARAGKCRAGLRHAHGGQRHQRRRRRRWPPPCSNTVASSPTRRSTSATQGPYAKWRELNERLDDIELQ